MAGKSHEMEFILNAALNGGFKGTMTKAQQEFVKLGNQIKTLNRAQSDISSYQKQQRAVQNTTAKLENYRKQYELLQQEIEETTGSTTALEREKLKLEQRISNTEGALERQNQSLTNTGDRLREAGVDTNNLTSESARLAAEMNELAQEQREAADGAEEFGDKSVSAFEAVQSALAAAGITTALREIYEGYMDCVNIAGDFEASMSRVEALSGAGADEMQQLTDKAKEMGAATRYTAQESADALGYMALAGWDTQSMLAGIAPVLNLATAANMDLAQASDIVTDYLTAFGLTAADASGFVDKMAYAMSHSNTDVVQLGEAYKNCAATAKSLGYTVEDTTAVIMTMANAGVKGGEAGTALNAIMTRLATNTKDCADALSDYGVEVYDSQGNMNSLADILNGMSGIWQTLTDQEQANLAKVIAGQNQYSALQTIMNGCSEAAAQGGQSFNDYAAALANCDGAAGKMAATMMDNLNGDLVRMQSAVDALKTTIGEQFIPEMRSMYSAGTDVVDWLNDFIQANPAALKAVAAGVTAVGAATAALTAYAAVRKTVKALELGSLFTGGAGVVIGVVAGVAALAAGIAELNSAANEGVASLDELTEAAREMDSVISDASAAYEETASSALAAANVADTYISKLEELGDYESLAADEQREYQNTLALLLQVMPELSSSISTATDQYGRTTYTLDGTTEALRANTEAIKENAMAQAMQDYLTDVYKGYADVLIEAQKNSIKLTEAEQARDSASARLEANQKRYIELYEEAIDKSAAYRKETGEIATETSFLTQEYYDLGEAITKDNIILAEAERNIEVYNQAQEESAEAVAAAEAAISEAEGAVRGLTGAVDESNGMTTEQIAQQNELTSIIEGTKAEIDRLTAAYNEAYDAALTSFSGQFGLFDTAQADLSMTVSSAQAALDSQLQYWQAYGNNIEILKSTSAESLGVAEADYNILMGYVQSGNEQAAGLAASMAAAIESGDKEAIAGLAKTIGEISKEQSRAADLTADWVSGLSEQMDGLVSDFESDVQRLDMSADASSAARSTIQGYINSANSMLPQVRAAFARLAQAAKSSLSVSVSVSQTMGGVKMAAYASGTERAKRGFAMVGEDGPEVMFMEGGEKILNAGQTAALQDSLSSRNTEAMLDPRFSTERAETAGGSAPVINITFRIEGNATTETVEALHRYEDEFAEKVLEVIEEARIDTVRRRL